MFSNKFVEFRINHNVCICLFLYQMARLVFQILKSLASAAYWTVSYSHSFFCCWRSVVIKAVASLLPRTPGISPYKIFLSYSRTFNIAITASSPALRSCQDIFTSFASRAFLTCCQCSWLLPRLQLLSSWSSR